MTGFFYVLSFAMERKYFACMGVELAKKQKLSNKEIIVELFEGKRSEDSLTAHQYKYLLQIRTAYGMHLEVKSRKYIVGALMSQFDISQDTAYRIIRESSQIFASIGKVDKEVYRHMVIEMAKAAYQLAKRNDNEKGMTNAANSIIKAVGLDREESDLPNFEKLQPSLILAILPEGIEERIYTLLTGGVVNLNEFPEAEYVEHEEIESRSAD